MALNLRRMEFVHPEILWALSALAIPIAIHLLHFRRYQKIAFSQVAFLDEIKRESKAMQKIRQWWILALRLLALSALILAFSQPYWPPTSTEEADASASLSGHAVSLYVDNSYSMEAHGEEGQLLQSAQNKAAVVIEQFDATDRFQIVTNDFSGRDQLFLTQQQALERIVDIEASPISRPIKDVLIRMGSQLEKETSKKRVGFLFSDLQKTTHTFSADPMEPDTGVTWHFVPELSSNTPNIWLDSIWFDEPLRIKSRPTTLRVRIRHNARKAIGGLPMHLTINDERIAIGTFNVVPGMATDTAIRFTHGIAGLKKGQLTIQDAPIRFDDDWHFGYEVIDRIRILHITAHPQSGPAQAVNRVYQSTQGQYELTTSAQWSPESLAEAHVVIVTEIPLTSSGFADQLAQFVKQGGTIMLMPTSGEYHPEVAQSLGLEDEGTWSIEADQVGSIASEHPFFKGVFKSQPERLNLPSLSEAIHRSPGPREEVLVRTQLGYPFFSKIPLGRGSVFVLGTSPSVASTNLTRHALWVPLLLRMAEQSSATPIHAEKLGSSVAWNVASEPEDTESVTLDGPMAPKTDQSLKSWIPEVRSTQGRTSIYIHDLQLEAGHYALTFSGVSVAMWGLNQDRNESDHTAFNSVEFKSQWEPWGWEHVDVLQTSTTELTQMIQRLEKGQPLWIQFVLLALLALLAETYFLHPWKRSSSNP